MNTEAERTADDKVSRLGVLLQTALSLQPERRGAWLDALPPTDRGLRSELEALLARAARSAVAGSSETMDGSLAEGGTALSSAGLAGEHYGPFHLLQPIAAGGMGEVWLAEQTGPVRRKVALKVIKEGMNSKMVIARFESERQALALMDHPAIAKVIDAGATPAGRPYFAMEYVAGIPIDRYCVEHRLSIPERLLLFVQVCEGVQHAHQKAIIHRDLKPSNVLVTTASDQPQAKIIDFGIAKAIGQQLTDKTLFTEIGAMIGTPEYMSPEQSTLTGEGIDTRTDVYALGVILYQLLTGSLPFGSRGKDCTADELRRRIREEDPPRPSSRVRAARRAAAGERPADGASMPLLARQLRGDLDAVVLKALERDRRRRYGSASEFAADLGRYLKHEPVLAVPPSASYRVGKFARRHRFGVATSAAFVLVLVGATAVSIRQTLRADREAAAAKAVNEFLQNDLLAQASASNQAGPAAKPDRDLKVRTALDRAAERIAGRFDRQPELEAAIRDTMGRTYVDLGEYPEAARQLERALELHRRSLGPAHPQTLDTLTQLASVYRREGKYPQSEALSDQALALGRRALGPEHPGTLGIMHGLATLYDLQGRYPESEALHQKVLEARRRVLGPEHQDTLESLNNLAAVSDMEGKYPQSEALYLQTIEARRRLLGPEHPATLWSMSELAWVYTEENKFEQAEALYAQVLESQRRVLGPEHPSTLASLNGQAAVYNAEGKLQQAEAIWRQVMEIMRRTLGNEHPNTLALIANVAEVSAHQGKYAQAAALAKEALEARRRLLGPDHPDTLASMFSLASLYDRQGRYAEAEALDGEVLEARRRVLGPEHPDTMEAMNNLAAASEHLGKHAGAEARYQQALEIERRALGPENTSTLRTLSALGDLSFRQGRYPAAEAFAAQALAGLRHGLGPENPDTMDAASSLALILHAEGKLAGSEALAREAAAFDRLKRPEDWQRFFAESLLGAILAGQKKHAEAEPLLLAGYQGLAARRARIAAADSIHLERALDWLVALYQDWGKPAKAAEWRRMRASAARPR